MLLIKTNTDKGYIESHFLHKDDFVGRQVPLFWVDLFLKRCTISVFSS